MLPSSPSLSDMSHSMWSRWPLRVDPDQFRREGDYLAQFDYGMTPQHYVDTYLYLVSHADRKRYLSRFTEDEEFGVRGVDFAGKFLTRDLLDSVLEINFLASKLDLKESAPLRVLDIGAGYGRFAHRFTAAFPHSFVYCADGIPKSSSICARYLKARGVTRTKVLTLTEVQELEGPVDLAVNIHSWSECTLRSIEAWLDLLVRVGTRHLFLVPHSSACMTMEPTGDHQNFLPSILRRGFEVIYSEPKYPDEMAHKGVYQTQYMLFERRP